MEQGEAELHGLQSGKRRSAVSETAEERNPTRGSPPCVWKGRAHGASFSFLFLRISSIWPVIFCTASRSFSPPASLSPAA